MKNKTITSTVDVHSSMSLKELDDGKLLGFFGYKGAAAIACHYMTFQRRLQ